VLLVESVFAALVRRWSVAVVRRCRRSLETHQRRALLAVDEVLQRRRAVHLNPRQSGPLTHRHTYPRVVKRYPPVEPSEIKVSAKQQATPSYKPRFLPTLLCGALKVKVTWSYIAPSRETSNALRPG